MEQELHQVVRDQEDQAQPVEAKGDWTEGEEAVKDPVGTKTGRFNTPVPVRSIKLESSIYGQTQRRFHLL